VKFKCAEFKCAGFYLAQALMPGKDACARSGPFRTVGVSRVWYLQSSVAAVPGEAKLFEEQTNMAVHASQRQPQSYRPLQPAPVAIPLMSEADLINPLVRIRDVIDPAAETCSRAMPLVEALRLLKHSGSGAIAVLERRRPAGFLTDRNAIAAIYDRPRDWELATVGEVMGAAPRPVSPDDTLDTIFDRLHRGGMFVVDSRGEFCGLVTWTSLAGSISERALGCLLATRVFADAFG
jgi:CBS domain-containing protein